MSEFGYLQKYIKGTREINTAGRNGFYLISDKGPQKQNTETVRPY